MNVLVTGGAGYIGSHAAKALALAGHLPVVYDNLSRGHRGAVKWGPLVIGQIADRQLMTATLKEHRIDAVLHFAAYAYVGESMACPGMYFENNCMGSLRLMEAINDAGVGKIIFSSTCATYGHPFSLPINENHPQIPVNPYGESKLIVEKLLRWYGHVHGIKWVALRYFNAAGADPDEEIGECHDPETHLIPLVLEAALDSARPVSVFGSDYPTSDGTAVRDYIHVTDLADAHVRALDYLGLGGESCALNLGTGSGSTIMQVIDMVERITGTRPSVRGSNRRAGDPTELVADSALARRVLGWCPSFSGLESIVKTAWRWRLQQNQCLAAGRSV